MINYEKYALIRDEKGMKDSDVAKKAGIYQSIFSDWKKGKSQPKLDKLQKIADALEMDYFEFVGPVGKYSSLNPNKPKNPLEIEVTATREVIPPRILEYAKRIMNLSENSQNELFNYMDYLKNREGNGKR